MRFFVTGGAGFIGSNLVDRLLSHSHQVVAFDNFSTGQQRFLEDAKRQEAFTLIEGDLLDRGNLSLAIRGCEFVFHLAANADVRHGLEHPEQDLQQNTTATFNVLEAMRENGIVKIAFSSTGSVYGEPTIFPTPEFAPFPIQTSLYGASKLASEGLIQAYCEGYGFNALIFRFVSILGERYSHGHVFDFYQRLRHDPHALMVLGDGHQRKSYLYVQDCIDAMLLAIDRARGSLNIFNLGTDEYCELSDSIGWITTELALTPKLTFGGGSRGWIGDSPFIFLDCNRLRDLGWRPQLSIREGVIRTVRYLQSNHWLLDARR